jgi:hypothetical protein
MYDRMNWVRQKQLMLFVPKIISKKKLICQSAHWAAVRGNKLHECPCLLQTISPFFLKKPQQALLLVTEERC